MKARLAIICVAVLLGCESRLLAQTLTVGQYAHTAWRYREGFANGPIHAISQTLDGYLWLGTEFGLLRFDGVRTVPWTPPRGQRLPSDEILSLLAARDGSLWIGTSKGLVRAKDDTLTHVDAFAGQYVYALLEARDGVVWAGNIALNDAKACAIAGSHVTCHGGNRQFGNVVTALHEDQDGGVWAAVVDGVWRLAPGPAEFYSIRGARDAIQSFATSEHGSLLTGPDGLWRLVGGKTEVYPLPDVAITFRPKRLLRDRRGHLWIGTGSHGLLHVTSWQTAIFPSARGLSGDYIFALFEDREGNIWVGTNNGLDRFREVAVPTFGAGPDTPNAAVESVHATNDGSIWFVANGILNRLRDSLVTAVPTHDGTPAGTPIRIPNSLLRDRRGRFWVSTLDGLAYLANNRFVWQPGVPGGSPVHDMTDDTGGNIWIASQNHGLIRVSPDGAVRVLPWATFGRSDFASAIVADPTAGGVWIGFQSGGITHFTGDRAGASYTAADGLGAGRINALRFDRHGTLWAATDGGLSRVRTGRVATLGSRNRLPCEGVHWAIEDDAQSAWLLMPCGLVRIPVAELESWAAGAEADPSRAVRTTLFNSGDGVSMRASAGGYSPQVAKSADGKIWFASTDGVSMVDPAHLPTNLIPPPVYVEGLTAGDLTYDARDLAAGVRLPPLTRDLRIDYTALSLVAPDRMQFRYQLEGHDRDWQDVGTRRQAFYTELAPGNYRFRVVASNNHGIWNETGATMQFTIAPAYYQTGWFLALSLGAALALVWSAHRLRVRVVEKHQQEITALNERLMKAQEQERIRIAGELHDGVMQQLLAVTMMVGTAKRRIADDSAARPTLEKISDKLVEVGSDIRRLSHDLHPPILQEAGLPQAMRAYCEQFSASSGIPVTCHADDGLDALSRGAALALFRIMQEALGNAAKHAKAGHITVGLTRSAGVVTLTIADDGVGFDRNLLSTSGGLGLITMRERAGQLNGQFRFETAPGRGTVITVEIPFR